MFEKNLFFLLNCVIALSIFILRVPTAIINCKKILTIIFLGKILITVRLLTKSCLPLLENTGHIFYYYYFYSKNNIVLINSADANKVDAMRVHIIDVQFLRCFIHEMSHADSLAVTLGYARSIYYANMRELYRTVIHPVIPGSFTLSRVQIVSYNLVDIVRKIDMCTAVIAQNFFKEYTFLLFLYRLYFIFY